MEDGLHVKEHAVERTGPVGRLAIAPLPTIGRAPGDSSLCRLQPAVELQLALQAVRPILSPRRRQGLESLHLTQSKGGQRILITEVAVAGADPPGPVLTGLGGAAPGV